MARADHLEEMTYFQKGLILKKFANMHNFPLKIDNLHILILPYN